ncbi:MAG: helix-turn-helix transcriptional regulator [Candidatus Pedobacter colombiensis]|uniref:Helix-turn-helix transcriptional regulator n=1 Tax=Candidatus Pedobacter colombiensis TaxID=3121371 RepID=A0AAJ5W5M9_9SPHI|nr:helix-turn-helix transcriptional regulator [Pedobacter sp.]WEK18397.1 MAG: helix-turn-helix transcriptional regulator [Pedobacter sp.]
MRSLTELPLPSSSHANQSLDELCDFSRFSLKMAEANYITLPEGIVLVQSIDHYLARIHLYEYKMDNHSIHDMEVTEPSFFMMAMLEGCFVLYNEAGETIAEVSDNSCKLIYLDAGKYQRSLISGEHQILLLTIKPEWLIKKYGALQELQELVNCYNQGNHQSFCLPGFNIGQQLFNALGKLNVGIEGRDIDIDMHIFIKDCISKYHHKLQTKISNTEYQVNKAKEIGDFIMQNFSNKIVDDEDALAKHFMTSKITLTRLAKRHFGKPLHKQVIELRMLNSLKMLLSTKKTIQEIATNIGYEDPHYFSRAFKKQFGLSPNVIRSCAV